LAASGSSLSKDRSPDPSNDELAALLHRVANRDLTAFAQLWAALSTETARRVQPMLSGPRSTDLVVSATFGEVWWLARFHDTPMVDVRAWIHRIAHTRAVDRRRAQTAEPSWLSATHDEMIMLEVGALIGDALAARPWAPELEATPLRAIADRPRVGVRQQAMDERSRRVEDQLPVIADDQVEEAVAVAGVRNL
jgi:DNA-directed RNA polymerase specialized sigma24 family protein